jgi:peptidoglycan/LPS O-acetylase OafA/YrhL
MTIQAAVERAVPSPPRVQAPTRFYPQLDGLRALAVVLVLLCHFDGGNVPHVLARIFIRGWIGVDAFFVLSGFLITKILLNCRPGPRGFGFFVLRRVLRTWPLYFVLLILSYLYFRHSGAAANIPWLRYLFFLQNYGGGQASTLAPTWSLCVEEHFYFVWPFLVFLLPRRALLPALILGFISFPLLRFWGWDHGYADQLYTQTQFHLDGLVAGSVVALLLPLHAKHPQACRRAAAVLFGLGAAATVAGLWRDGEVAEMVRTGHDIVFAFTSLAAMFAGLLWILIHEESSLLVRLFSLWPLRYIGRISYGIYILHFAVAQTLALMPLHRILGSLADSWLFMMPLRIGAVIVVAAVSYEFFESPILRLKERLK